MKFDGMKQRTVRTVTRSEREGGAMGFGVQTAHLILFFN